MDYTKPGGFRINKLQDEIEAANIPGMTPVTPPGPRPGPPRAAYSITPDNATIISPGVFGTIAIEATGANSTPIDFSPSGQLQAVINAHSPTLVANPDDTMPILPAGVRTAIANGTALNAAQQVVFNRDYVQFKRFVAKRLTGNPESVI